MSILFEAIKLIFFVMTIFLALIMTKGELLFGPERTEILSNIFIPAYMIFIGLLLGYILALLIMSHDDDPTRKNRIMTNMFVVGMILGIILALCYIFVL